MSVKNLSYVTPFVLDENINGDEKIVVFDLSETTLIKRVSLSSYAKYVNEAVNVNLYYSFDGVSWFSHSQIVISDVLEKRYNSIITLDNSSQFLYFKFIVIYTAGAGQAEFGKIHLITTDLVSGDLSFSDSSALNIGLPSWQGYNFIDNSIDIVFPYIVSQTFGNETGGGNETPTSTNIITGNVQKLGLPFAAEVVAVSLGANPKVVGKAVSDEITGDYSVDVYPYTEEVLLYVSPDYGRKFEQFLAVSAGMVFHPSTPNKYIYIAQNDGVFAGSEPIWNITGNTTSGNVVLTPKPLHKPLINGFIKPIITPIP